MALTSERIRNPARGLRVNSWRNQFLLRGFSRRGFCCFLALCLAATAIAAGNVNATQPRVGVYYFPGWYRTGGDKPMPPYDRATDWSEWRGAIAKGPFLRPLAGFYDDSDPWLWSYYLDWMRKAGIDFIAFNWYYNAGQDYLSASLDEGFLQAPENEQIEFCLHWCNHGGYWWDQPLDQSPAALAGMMDRVARRYMHRPNYLKHQGRPVFMIYDIDILLAGNGASETRAGIEAMRRVAREHGHPDLYLVAVYSYYGPDIIEQLHELGFDAFCGYTYVGLKSARVNWDSKSYPYRDVADRLIDFIYPHLERTGRRQNIPYWPTAFAGWDNSPRIGKAATILTGNTPAEFGRLFRAALEHVSEASPYVIVEAWNEWGEGSSIEPSKQFGFGYLQEMARSVGRPTFEEKVPSAEEIGSWSILSEDELQRAGDMESMEQFIDEPGWFAFGRDEEVPAPNMPVTLEFGTGGVDFKRVFLNNLAVLERTDKGVLLETRSAHNGIEITIDKLPREAVRRIRIEAESEESAFAPRRCEFFWATTYMPGFSPFASVPVLLREGRSIEISTDEIPGWDATGTPLTRLRFDLPKRAGAKVLLQRMVLE